MFYTRTSRLHFVSYMKFQAWGTWEQVHKMSAIAFACDNSNSAFSTRNSSILLPTSTHLRMFERVLNGR
jgi:hypothetical protein